MNILFRAQEWLADRVSFVQYPRIRRVMPQYAAPRKLALEERILVGAFSLVLLVVGIGLVVAGCFVLYMIFTA